MSAESTAASCIFCSIVAGDLPSSRIDEDERTITFLDINPATRGHALVVPREHARDLLTVDASDLAACTVTAQRIATRAVERLGADGVNVLNCCGEAAWQSVFHFHLHVVPRYADTSLDGVALPWVPTPGDPAALAEVAALLTAD